MENGNGENRADVDSELKSVDYEDRASEEEAEDGEKIVDEYAEAIDYESDGSEESNQYDNTEADDEQQLTQSYREEDAFDRKHRDPFYEILHQEKKTRHSEDDIHDKEGNTKKLRLHKGPLSGTTKAVLTLLVIWTAVIGIILVRYNLTVQNAREAAIAAKEKTRPEANVETSQPLVTQEKEETKPETSTASEEASAATEETVETDQLTFRCLFKNATGWDQINKIAVYLSPGRDTPMSETVEQLSLTQDGYVVSAAPPGEYTMSWHAEGYYDGYENITIGDSMLDMEKNLIPIMPDVRNCTIMLEWKGDRDLDLCLFDAHTQQYINILYPEEHGNFLFEDTTSNRRCEVIRIADCTQSQVYSVYVRDDNLLRNIASENTISMMERDGVSITVATAAGIIARKTADPGYTSALWNPLYVYEAQTYSVDNYITDFTNDSWAFYDKTVR